MVSYTAVLDGIEIGRLTVSPSTVYASLLLNEINYFIEPSINFDAIASLQSLVLYKQTDVRPSHHEHTCAHHSEAEYKENQVSKPENRFGNCYEVPLAIAADYSMYVDPAIVA